VQDPNMPPAMQPMGGFGQGGPMQPYAANAQGGQTTWDIGGVLSGAWETFKPNWVVYVFAPFVGGIVAALPYIIMAVLAGVTGVSALLYIGMLLLLVGMSFVSVGMIRIFVKGARGETPSFGEVFSGADRFLPMLLSIFILYVVTWIGMLLLVVPGVILGCGLSMTTYLVADKKMGAIDALKASWAATDGQKLQLFLFSLVAFLIILAGYLACGLGVFVAAPLVGLAHATIYLRLTSNIPSQGQAQQ
jgi:uncharacterized membrane protein